ncbi:polyprotein [Phytophthora megakarya]|uniref:Polyprotein n=1 Tax=Phytophthora megakarya TaxID=4795 RepID=A0A225WQJ4_9STRA|nr:polyprotein [Phytophthora megakarya]
MLLMGVKLSMTTAHRAQADGQTERRNLGLEYALRGMVTYHGDDWEKNFGAIAYAHSALVNAPTKLTLFDVGTGRKVSHIIAEVVFKQCDLVLLDTKNLPLRTVNKNTELKKTNLMAKKRMINGNVAKLILQISIKRLNPTFNIELLTHFQTNRADFPNRPIPKAVQLISGDETGEELLIVEKRLKKRTRRRKREWLI